MSQNPFKTLLGFLSRLMKGETEKAPELPLEPIPDNEKGKQLAQQIEQAEKAYDDMYESRDAGAAYSEMKESMFTAIQLAGELGLTNRKTELEKTLEHRKSVFRSQMK